MSEDKTSISKASSYEEIGEFWSKHDLAKFWEQTEPAEFEVEIESEKRYYPLDRDLSLEFGKIAQRRGVSATCGQIFPLDKWSRFASGEEI